MLKRLISVLLCIILMGACIIPSAYASEMEYPRKREDIGIRDPCILVSDGKYYMYGTGAAWQGYGCYVSEDLENWAGPFTVFTFPEGHTADGDYWAPECVEYKGSFYLFATYHDSVLNHRGTAVFRASSPLGPFEQISDGFATPDDWDSIDGTLYVDSSGQPWMIFVHEWTSTDDGIGRMCVAKMSDDLSSLISEPKEIFRADDGKLSMNRRVTDGPYIHTCEDGKLIMLWSNFTDDGYAVGMAESYTVDGKWKQQPRFLFHRNISGTDYDGGHGMLFTSLDGRLMLSVHSPNSSGEGYHETAVFHEVVEVDGTLRLKSEQEKLERTRSILKVVFSSLAEIMSAVFGAMASLITAIINSII